MELPVIAIPHTPVFHLTDAMPLPKGTIPVAMHAKSLEAQQKLALSFYNFLSTSEPPPALLKLNEGINNFVALINIPKQTR